MSQTVTLNLPFPPSGNHMWHHTRSGQHYLTNEAKQFYATVILTLRAQTPYRNLNEPLEVTCYLTPPDRRRRDLDNAWKVMGDAITRSGLWTDDKLIKKLTLIWREPAKPSGACVIVRPFKVISENIKGDKE
jgi:crossover junction endodeoxyribonuclease RusA